MAVIQIIWVENEKSAFRRLGVFLTYSDSLTSCGFCQGGAPSFRILGKRPHRGVWRRRERQEEANTEARRACGGRKIAGRTAWALPGLGAPEGHFGVVDPTESTRPLFGEFFEGSPDTRVGRVVVPSDDAIGTEELAGVFGIGDHVFVRVKEPSIKTKSHRAGVGREIELGRVSEKLGNLGLALGVFEPLAADRLIDEVKVGEFELRAGEIGCGKGRSVKDARR